MERYLRVNLLGLSPRLIKKRNYRAAVSQRFRTTVLDSRLTDGGEVVSLTRRPAALYPQEDSWYSYTE
jgi:hypothetical protein